MIDIFGYASDVATYETLKLVRAPSMATAIWQEKDCAFRFRGSHLTQAVACGVHAPSTPVGQFSRGSPARGLLLRLALGAPQNILRLSSMKAASPCLP